MPEIIVKYKSKKTLEALQDLFKCFDYAISKPGNKEGEKNKMELNGITIIQGDSSIDPSDLTDIFSGKNIRAEQLRSEAWQRKK